MNRSLFALSLALAPLAGASLLVPGCVTNDNRPPFAIADWRVRCDSVMGMCAEPLARQVTGENGESGNSISCNVTEDETSRTVNAMIGGTGPVDRMPFEVSITNARVPRAGGFVGGGACSVTVIEGVNRYRGACGSAAPTTDQPCQVEIEFSFDTMSQSNLTTFHIFCDHLPNEATSEQLRSFTSHLSAVEPADIELYNCRGQTRD
jgi:hypothetical protein